MDTPNNGMPAAVAGLGEAMATAAEEFETARSGALVMVYGTLKKGKSNHHPLLDDAEYMGRCAVAGQWDLYDVGWFPAVVRRSIGPRAYVVGEVYKVDSDTLRSLDLLEGHPHFYERIKVDTPWKQAWLYTMPPRTALNPSWRLLDKCWRPTNDEKEWLKPLGDPNNGV